MTELDQTHDPHLRCWVPGADGHPEFPVQNLPLGVFSPERAPPRLGVAIGDSILDIADLLPNQASSLNAFLSLGAGPRAELRASLSKLLTTDKGSAPDRLHAAANCTLHLPCDIGDYTDFYAGIHHATNVGRQFRPDTPLLPNYKYVPVGYHGRASSVRPSGTKLRRPCGQTKRPHEAEPSFGPTRCLDYELELGIWIGPGNELGDPIPIGQAADHIAGYCLLNDWSARDIQGWEYQPLGPFLAKSFATTISPWIVTPEALAPFRIPQPPRPEGDPAPLPHLTDATDQAQGAFDLALEVSLLTQAMRDAGTAPFRLSVSNARHLYWTPAQMVAHHASGGCNLRPGDLFGTGTISGPDSESCGSLLEATLGGRRPVTLPNGEERRFLEDGDEILLEAHARRDGFAPIGFGACRAAVG